MREKIVKRKLKKNALELETQTKSETPSKSHPQPHMTGRQQVNSLFPTNIKEIQSNLQSDNTKQKRKQKDPQASAK